MKLFSWGLLPVSWIALAIISLVLFSCHPAHAQMITEGVNKGLTVEQVIGYRLEGIAARDKAALDEAKTAKSDLDTVQVKYDWYVIDDAKAWDYGKEKALEAHNNAKQRDVLVYIFSLIAGFWLLSQYQNMQIPILPPWKWLIEAAFFLAGFGAAYAFGRFALAWAAHFIP